MWCRELRDDSSISPRYVKPPAPLAPAVSVGTCAVVATRASTALGALGLGPRLAMNMYAPERTRYRRQESGRPIDFSGGFTYYVQRTPQKPFSSPPSTYSRMPGRQALAVVAAIASAAVGAARWLALASPLPPALAARVRERQALGRVMFRQGERAASHMHALNATPVAWTPRPPRNASFPPSRQSEWPRKDILALLSYFSSFVYASTTQWSLS